MIEWKMRLSNSVYVSVCGSFQYELSSRRFVVRFSFIRESMQQKFTADYFPSTFLRYRIACNDEINVCVLLCERTNERTSK